MSHETVARQRTSIRDIQSMVAADSGISVERMTSSRRDKPVVNARHAAMWLAREANYTLNDIGRAFGRDHTTVMHGVRRIDRLLRTDGDLGAFLGRFQFAAAETDDA